MSDNLWLGSAAILDKIRGWPEGWGQEGDPLDTLTLHCTKYKNTKTKYRKEMKLQNQGLVGGI